MEAASVLHLSLRQWQLSIIGLIVRDLREPNVVLHQKTPTLL